MTDLQRLEKTLKEILDRLQKLENQQSKQGGTISATAAASNNIDLWNLPSIQIVDGFLRLKETDKNNWLDLQIQLFEDMAYPDEYNPFFHIEQGFWCQKDVFSQGFLGSASRIYITFGGTYTPAVPEDIGRTVKDDGVYSGTLVGYWNSETDYLNLPTSVDPEDPTAPTWWLVGYYPIASGSTITIPSGTGGGVTNADWATQPGGGAVMVSHGLTGPDDPPKTILSSAFLGFDRYHFVDIESNLVDIAVRDIELTTINGAPPGGEIVSGANTTDANGDRTVTFDEEFDNVPKVLPSVIDAAGRMITIVVVSKSTTQFVVKAKILETHKHKIGAIGASGAGATHSHTINTENQSQTSGPDMPGGTEDVAGPIHSHTVQAHNHGGSTGTGGPTSTGYSAPATGTPSATQEVNVPLSGPCELGHALCKVTSSYQVYPASGTHIHTVASHAHPLGQHNHTIPTENQSQTSGPDSGTTTVASSVHSHTVQAHNHNGATGSTQIAPYIRALDLRNIGGTSEICGAVLINSDEPAVDLYTEETAAAGVAVNFEWMAIPA